MYLTQYCHVFTHVTIYMLASVLQRAFIRNNPDGLEVDLHKKFGVWVQEKGLSSPTEDQWKTIMEEDRLVQLHSYS